ncbi:MAG: right-handed parallel beta-helix repeat-containing protein, partial [Bacteroidota bacterium]
MFKCLFALLGVLLPHLVSAQCLLPSGIGSFEGSTPLADWFTAHQGNGNFQLETSDVSVGAQALRIDVTTPSTWEVRMFNHASCYFPLVQGESYQTTLHIKGNAGDPVVLTLMDNLSDDASQTIFLTSNGWATYNVTLNSTVDSDSGRFKIQFQNVGTYFLDEVSLVRETENWYVSPSGANNLAGANGSSPGAPLQTIQYALDSAWTPGDTIFVMNGTYRNNNFGTGNVNNGPVVRLNPAKTGAHHGWLIIRNYPGHNPKIEFDGSGGFIGSQQTYLEISGFEIEGPNQAITFPDAMANRLIQDNYYGGRGVAVWSGHHIYLHGNRVHDCPNSGLRVNNADYCTVHNNVVYNNTWWSSNAESAIVYATAMDIDTLGIIKMRITDNLVYDNYNNIPYYNPTYTGATSDYGTAAQTYIIDGSGCYVTRNRDTYLYGWFYFANNVSYGNGINGLVVHKSDRAVVTNNTVFWNGAVPLASGRQASSGITVHGSDSVRMYNNISWPRFATDFGYKVFDWPNTVDLIASNNILANGLSDLTAGQVTMTNPMFVDTANKNFRLQPGSPAIDGGQSHGDLAPFDFDGNPRDL